MKGNLSESPEFGARWIQMSRMAPENLEVRAGTAEATRGQVMLALPPRPLRSEGLAEAPGEDACRMEASGPQDYPRELV